MPTLFPVVEAVLMLPIRRAQEGSTVFYSHLLTVRNRQSSVLAGQSRYLAYLDIHKGAYLVLWGSV